MSLAVAIGIFLIGISVFLDKNHFIISQSEFFIQRVASISLTETLTRMKGQYPHILDIHFNLTRPIWYDIWYRDQNVTGWHQGFAKEKGYHEFIRYMPCEPKSERLHAILHAIMLHSYADPLVYITWNPFYMLYPLSVCGPFFLLPHHRRIWLPYTCSNCGITVGIGTLQLQLAILLFCLYVSLFPVAADPA